MTTENLEKLLQVVNEAMELPRERRVAFIRTECAGDVRMAADAERIVALDDDLGEFLSEPAAEAASVLQSITRQDEEENPDTVGPYAVVRRIGRGGMGSVYLATQQLDNFSRQVAVKVIRRGMDTDAVVSRFRVERNILASLNHPNIARLLDAGSTEDGRAYFVMEYVDGQPITDYCDARKLDVDQRLELFETVCEASHYAHQNLVVHRDVKPSNILVTEDGTVMLLDFGVAKLLDPSSLDYTVPDTVTASVFLTPDYASPEQIRGETISTATDVYSLGILLYELLSGHRPFRSASESRIDFLNRVCNAVPRKPSTSVNDEVSVTHHDGRASTIGPVAVSNSRSTTPRSLRGLLSGDLDTIVLKAIRKSPDDRYASIVQLREDVARYRNGEPITARPATLTYRARKIYQRNRIGVLSLIAVVLGIMALTTVYVSRLAAERNAAEQASQRAETVKDFVVGLLEQGTNIGGIRSGIRDDEQVRAALTLIEPALESLDGLEDDPASHVAVLNIVGDVLNINSSEEKAIEVLREAVGVIESTDLPLLTAAETWHQLGRAYYGHTENDSALHYSTMAFEARRAALGPSHGVTLESQKYVAWAGRRVYGDTEMIETLVPQVEAAFGPLSVELANVLSDSAPMMLNRDVQIEYLEQALSIYEETTGLDDPLAATTMATLGLTIEQEDSTRALDLTSRASRALEASIGPTHRLSLTVLGNLGAMYAERGRHREADSVLDASDERYRELQPDRESPGIGHLFWHAMADVGLGEYDTAIDKLRTVLIALPANHGFYDDTLEMYLVSMVGLGKKREAREKLDDVMPSLRKAGQIDEERIEDLRRIVR